MSRASGRLTSRSNNTSRQGTIQSENPGLISSLLQDDKVPDKQPTSNRSDHKTPNQQRASSKTDKSVTFEPKVEKSERPPTALKKGETGSSSNVDPDIKTPNGENYKQTDKKEENVEEIRPQRDLGKEVPSENFSNIDGKKEVSKTTDSIDESVKVTNTVQNSEDTDKTQVTQEVPSEIKDNSKEAEETSESRGDQKRFVSVNWDSENYDEKTQKGANIKHNKEEDIPEGVIEPLPPVTDDPDRHTLKSAASTSSELAGLHSPSRKSLNIDLGDEVSKSEETENEGGDDEERTPVAGAVVEPGIVKAPEAGSRAGPGPTYSAVSPRASRSSFHQGNAITSAYQLEDAKHPRFTTPYSSQRLKSQGQAAKRSTSVSTITKDSLDSFREPVKEEEENEETKRTAPDSLDIEKDSLDVDSEIKNNKSLKKGEHEVYKNTQPSSQKAESKEDNANSEIEKVNDFSEDSLNNSNSVVAGIDGKTDEVDKDKPRIDFLSEPAHDPVLQTDRSDSSDTIRNEPITAIPVSNNEKDLSGPALLDNQEGEVEENEEEKDSVEQVEFVIKTDPGKPGPSRYSSAAGSGRNSDLYFREKREPFTNSAVSHNSARRSNRTTPSTRKVYVESPTFTKEEEGEYRYVRSRLDDLGESGRFDTYRGLDMAAVQRQEAFDGMSSNKMPEKRVRYSGIDTQHVDTDRVDYGNRGSQEFVNENVGFGSQDYQRNPRSINNDDNNFSTDESDKENARRNSYANSIKNTNYSATTTQQQPQYNQQRQQQRGPPASENPPSFYSKLYSQQQGYSALARQGYSGQPQTTGQSGYQFPDRDDLEMLGHQAVNPAVPVSFPPQSQDQSYSQQDKQPGQHQNYYQGPSGYQQQQQQQQQRDPKPPVKGLSLRTGPSYDPADEEDLKRETEYQHGLKNRIDSGNRRAQETVIPTLSLNQGRIQYQGEGQNDAKGQYFQGHNQGSQPIGMSRDYLDYDSQDTGRGYESGGDFRRDSLDVYNGRNERQERGYNLSQAMPDSERYQDYGNEDYSDYENVREHRMNPQVQPRFYDPRYDRQYQGDNQPPGASEMNTDRSDMDDSTYRTRDDAEHGEYSDEQNPNGYGREGSEVMDAVRPKPPKYDYVEHNKEDYGKQPSKSYMRIHEINKEEKDKLDGVFIHPKPKPKGGILKKRGPSQASQASLGSDTGRKSDWTQEPPQYEDTSEMSAAEQVWMRRASVLANQRQDVKKGSKKGPSLQKYNSDSAIHQISQPPRNQSYQQIRQAHVQYNQPSDQGSSLQSPQRQPPQQHYRQQQQQHQHQQQQQQQPPPSSEQLQRQQPAQPPMSRDKRAFMTDLPTPVNDQSYGHNQDTVQSPRHEIQLQPITQQFTTEDGQKISVDVNLKLISPPPPLHPHQQQNNYGQQQQQQHQQPFYATLGAGAGAGRQYRAVPAHYEPEEEMDVLLGNGQGGGYNYVDLDSYPTPRERYSADEALRALYESRTDMNPFGRIPPIPNSREGHPLSAPVVDQGGSYMDMYRKQKRQENVPWYKVYNLNDFRKMKKEVHLGTLGPDLDSDILRERKEKVQRQTEYAKLVQDRNRHDLVHRKPPSFPRPKENNDIMNRRKVAVEYAKSVPKPTVRPNPTEYNNYELASEKSPIAKSHKKAPSNRASPAKNLNSSPSPNKKENEVETVNLDKMRRRYEEDKQNEALIRRNTGSAGGMHGYYTEAA